MKIVSVIPIFRKKFQEPIFCFSQKEFTIGALVFATFKKKRRVAIAIEIDDLKNKKSFIRKNKIVIGKIENPKEILFLKKEIIDLIFLASEKTKISPEKIFQKIFSKKDIEEITKKKLVEKNLRKISEKITAEKIKEKLSQKIAKKESSSETGIKDIGFVISRKTFAKKRNLSSEKHYLTNEIRNYFGETAKKGVGSFSFYLGFFKKIPEQKIYQFWSEVKQSRKPLKNQQKIFWWKIGNFLKNEKNAGVSKTPPKATTT